MASLRLQAFENELFASLNAQKRTLEAAGVEVFDFSVGTPDFPPPAHVMRALVEAAEDPKNWRYSLHAEDELIDAVRAYYAKRFGVDLANDEVALAAGTQEGMAYLALSQLDPGDVALVPDPCYPVFQGAIALAGATPAFYPLTKEHGFLPWMGAIDPEVANAATYLVVSLPSNPVGSVARPGVYEEIVAFAKEHDLIVVHDNAYSDIVFEGGPGGSFLATPGAKEVGVEFFSLSKSFNVTGARLSFLVGRRDVVAAFAKLRGQFDFGMFTPLQRAARAALEGPLDEVERLGQVYKRRRDALVDSLEAIGWQPPSAQGTMFVWAELPERYASSWAFVEELMEATGVIVSPGASFGPHGEGYVRFALVMDEARIKEAVALMGEAGFGGESA